MGKRTDELAGDTNDVYAGEAEGVSVSGMTAAGVRPAGVLGTSGATDDLIGTYGATDTSYGTSDEVEDDDIAQTRSQIEQTREQMSHTIDAIQDKLSPQRMANQARDAVRDATIGKATTMVNNAGDSAKGFGAGFVDTVKQNPVPAALAGFGLGWLLMSGRKSRAAYRGNYRSYDYGRNYGYDRGRDYGVQGTGPVQGAQQKVSDLAQGAQGTVSDVASRAQDAAGQLTGQMQDTAGQLAAGAQSLTAQASETIGDFGAQAQYGVQQAQSGFRQMLRQNPLGVAAGALAVGLAVGLAIPETDKENEVLGPARDNLVQQAQQTIGDTAQKVQSVAQEAVGAATDAAKQEAENQGLPQSH